LAVYLTPPARFDAGMRTSQLRRTLATLIAAVAVAVGAVAAPAAFGRSLVPKLDWKDCGGGFQCATAEVPRDYAHRRDEEVELALIRLPATDPAHRIGSLFVNFGGPGASGVDTLRQVGSDWFASLNDRFDIVGFDPRGVGASEPSIDCRVNQETDGIFAKPFPRPSTADAKTLIARAKRYVKTCVRRNRAILPYVSTANVARDLDLLRQAVGDSGLTYLGYSYGTFLGATYASLFPSHIRALVLDGPLDADEWINRPRDVGPEQAQALEVELGRFFATCAAQQDVCGFGGSDPAGAFDALVAKLDAAPIPAVGDDPRPVDGDDARAAAAIAMYAKQFWPDLAQGLAQAEQGDGTVLRALADLFFGWQPGGAYDPENDRFFTISALEQRNPHDLQQYLDAGAAAFSRFPHFWWSTGYSELPWGLYPVKPRGVFYGPFVNAPSAPTALVVATTYDPATPYAGAQRLVQELGNARLLTMDGDGHTAYPGNSQCVDAAVEAYFEDLALPPADTVCQQDVPFARSRREGTLPALTRLLAGAAGVAP
jgi:pimeloyl-ACP methyl ester carboxylesterase